MGVINYYVYVRTGKYWWYERSCGTEQAAIERVAVLESRGHEARYTVGTLICGALY